MLLVMAGGGELIGLFDFFFVNWVADLISCWWVHVGDFAKDEELVVCVCVFATGSAWPSEDL